MWWNERTTVAAWDDEYDDDEEDGEPPLWKRPALWAAAAAVIVAIIAVAYVMLKRDSSSNDASSSTVAVSAAAPESSPAAASATNAPGATTGAGAAPVAVASTESPATTVAATTTAAATTTVAPTTTAAPLVAESPTTAAAAPPAQPPTYSTLPDGSPAPIIAVFGTENITLSGAVPNQAAKDTLQALAIANSKTPVPVNNLLTIDPTVPPGIGVRVVELTSARFEPNSAVVQGFHALELNRVVSVMNALPNVTALVIGHADQIGSDAQNFKISAERATAVVNYMVAQGISPSRLSSRAVGDQDLLTLNDDAASLALNRRTEFVLYGLLGQ